MIAKSFMVMKLGKQLPSVPDHRCISQNGRDGSLVPVRNVVNIQHLFDLHPPLAAVDKILLVPTDPPFRKEEMER